MRPPSSSESFFVVVFEELSEEEEDEEGLEREEVIELGKRVSGDNSYDKVLNLVDLNNKVVYLHTIKLISSRFQRKEGMRERERERERERDQKYLIRTIV